MQSGDLWVFGYGSLIWEPGFDFVERRLLPPVGVVANEGDRFAGSPVLELECAGADRSGAVEIGRQHIRDIGQHVLRHDVSVAPDDQVRSERLPERKRQGVIVDDLGTHNLIVPELDRRGDIVPHDRGEREIHIGGGQRLSIVEDGILPDLDGVGQSIFGNTAVFECRDFRGKVRNQR